ncbi:MAG: S41 family peptidase [Candidatus Woesebacteria bacterium]|nr:MAG: S41 family peptidase [Candidatus Woesebacteria bacterium]
MAFKLSFSKVRKSVLGVLLLLVVFVGGYQLGVQGFRAEVTKSFQVKINRQLPPDKNVDFSLFWQVWDTLSAKYYDKSKLVPSEMVNGAIAGMVAAVGDPYTMFLPPKENKVVNEDLSGSFEGVGIEIGYKENKLAVISPLPDSPAERAGVKAGDFIVRITDTTKKIDVATNAITLPEAVQNIRGPAGTKVSLTLIREGNQNPIVIELTRAKLDVPSVTLNLVGQNKDIAHVKLSKFDSRTTSEWDKVVGQILQNSKIKGIIVDLRNDPGGYLQSAVDIAGEFVPTGTTIVIEERGEGTKIEYKSDKLGRLQNYKVVVLINGGSASASEIFSGALRDIRHFKLVGEKSFGKGTVQEPIDTANGSGLHVTTAKWLTPNGTWVHGVGLTPDVVITPKDSDKEDVILQGAIKLFN